MTEQGGGLVHREVMELRATPAQVREFIFTPERVLEYYISDAVEAGTFEEGRLIWTRGEGSVTLLELVEDESSDECRVMLVTTALGLEPPFTPEAIRAASSFSLLEDWEIAPSPDGTTLTKSWRDVRPTRELPFPLEEAIREAAKAESAPLIEKWNAAALREEPR